MSKYLIYNILENGDENWNNTYDVLSTSGKYNIWNDSVTSTEYLSTGITTDSVEFDNLYSIVTSYSAIWANQETEAVMVSSNKWNEVYISYNLYYQYDPLN